jgi:hypothetical protein
VHRQARHEDLRRSVLSRVQHVRGQRDHRIPDCGTAPARPTRKLPPRSLSTGKSVPVAEVETRLLNIVLPAGNLFDLPAGTQGLSVGHGWVALLHPLTPGTHLIVIHTSASTIRTTITVRPRH